MFDQRLPHRPSGGVEIEHVKGPHESPPVVIGGLLGKPGGPEPVSQRLVSSAGTSGRRGERPGSPRSIAAGPSSTYEVIDREP